MADTTVIMDEVASLKNNNVHNYDAGAIVSSVAPLIEKMVIIHDAASTSTKTKMREQISTLRTFGLDCHTNVCEKLQNEFLKLICAGLSRISEDTPLLESSFVAGDAAATATCMTHAAALGMDELCDAAKLVVVEPTGAVSADAYDDVVLKRERIIAFLKDL